MEAAAQQTDSSVLSLLASGSKDQPQKPTKS